MENEVKQAIKNGIPVGLIRDKGKVYFLKEVFLVDSVDAAKQKVEQGINKVQVGLPVNVDSGCNLKLAEMQEITKQLEIKHKMQTSMLEYIERNNVTNDDMIRLISSFSKW